MLWAGCCVAVTFLVSTSRATDVPDACAVPPPAAVCRAAIPMFFYNSSAEECQEFIYGGCPDVHNKFPTREACVRTCSPDTCTLPPDVGPCKANIRLWFFSARYRTCQQFSYGGCQGNQNRFSTREHCEAACAGTNLPCVMGDDFHTIGSKAIHANYRDKEYFSYGCARRCRERCTDRHPWGTCLAYSARKRWYGCNCYLYDRFLSPAEFDHDTSGSSNNRLCSDGTSAGD